MPLPTTRAALYDEEDPTGERVRLLYLKKLKTRIDAMSPPAFWILKLSFFATYFCLLCALVCAVGIFRADGLVPMSRYAALEAYLRLPQAVLLVGVLGSAAAEEVYITRR